MLRLKINRFSSIRALSLASMFLIGFASLTALVSVAAVVIVRQSERSYLMDAFRSINREKLKLFEAASLDDIIAEDIPQVTTNIMGFINEDRDLRSIDVTGADGVVLLHWTKNEAPRGDYSLTQPVDVAGERFGKIEASWDTTNLSQRVKLHAEVMALAVVAICFLMSVIGFLLVRWFAIKPLNRIVVQLNRLRSGGRGQPGSLSRIASTELRRLDQAVNMLSDFMEHERQRESELAVARDIAVAANKTKSEFLANMSHELRTPLNAVIGFAALMRAETFGPISNRMYAEYVEHIHSAGEHLLAVISDILDISKIEAGKLELCEESVDIKALIEGCIVFVRDRAVQSGIRLKQHIAPDLGKIRADGLKLKQAIVNLLSNAVKFTPKDGFVSVDVSHDRDGALRVSIADTGIGIAAEHMNKVLEPFAQVDSAFTRRVGGTGLGLPLAKSLIELHGGTLLLESKVGIGTEVVVILPGSLSIQDPPFEQNRVVALPQDRPTKMRAHQGAGDAARATTTIRLRRQD